MQLRPPQRRIIQKMLTGNDGLFVLGTSHGKSLCYQLLLLAAVRLATAAASADGTTPLYVMAVPLSALQGDQLQSMRELAERLDLPTAIAATTAKAPAKSDTDSRDGENGLKRDEG